MCDDTAKWGGGIGAAVSVVTFFILHVGKPLFTATNHKRIRSNCCGRACVTSLDVEDTTPVTYVVSSNAVEPQLKVSIPTQ